MGKDDDWCSCGHAGHDRDGAERGGATKLLWEMTFRGSLSSPDRYGSSQIVTWLRGLFRFVHPLMVELYI